MKCKKKRSHTHTHKAMLSEPIPFTILTLLDSKNIEREGKNLKKKRMTILLISFWIFCMQMCLCGACARTHTDIRSNIWFWYINRILQKLKRFIIVLLVNGDYFACAVEEMKKKTVHEARMNEARMDAHTRVFILWLSISFPFRHYAVAACAHRIQLSSRFNFFPMIFQTEPNKSININK